MDINFVKTIILGIVEGLTEFLPISSSGHLILFEKWLKFSDSGEIFTVVIQIGAIAAAIWYFREEIAAIINKLIKGDWRLFVNLSASIAPVLIIGFVFRDSLDSLFRVSIVGWALLLGGLAIILFEWKLPKLGHVDSATEADLTRVSLKQSILMGLFQVLSLIPGVSRSGSSIIGGMVGGMNRRDAARFSFIVGLPLLMIATLYKLISKYDQIDSVQGGVVGLIVGTFVSLIVALVVIGWLVRFLKGHSLVIFGYYRIVLGIVILYFFS
jgi:undecaprenyl-diphosphatase